MSTNNTALDTPTTPSPIPTTSIISDTGASGFYLSKGPPCSTINPQAPKVLVGTATGQTQASSDSCHLNLDLPVTDAHIMPGFQNFLLGIGKLFDEYCTVLFTKHSVQVFNIDGDTILTGRCDHSGSRLWCFSLLPQNTDTPPAAPITTSTTAAAISVYDLPSVEYLVRFYHALSGLLVKYTWLRAIKAGSSSWPVLTATNATKYCPKSIDTKKLHMNQKRQGFCSTNPKCSKPIPVSPLEEHLPPVASNGVHIRVDHI